MIGEAEGFIGHDRGYYFYGGFIRGGNVLITAKYSKDGVDDTMLDLFLSLFPSNANSLLCDRKKNRIHHFRQYATELFGSAEHFEAFRGAFRFKSPFSDVDAQGT